MSKPVVLFVPPKILSETSKWKWSVALGNKFLTLIAACGREGLGEHRPDMFGRMEFFDNFNDNLAVELRAHEIATGLVTAMANMCPADLGRGAGP